MAVRHHEAEGAGRSPSLAEFWSRVDPEGDAGEPGVRRGTAEEARATTLVIPGLYDSGPEHWQSLWCLEDSSCRRVELGDWDRPSRALWVSRLDRAIAREREPVVLAAHSLGCLAVAWWAAEASGDRLQKVRAALLVAPPDVDRPGADPRLGQFAPAPSAPLPFPALLIASRDDRYARFERLAMLAGQWGAGLVDVGALGHINAESLIDDWPEGKALLRALHAPRPIDAAGLEAFTGYRIQSRPCG
jgi:predicted alpha/beta hydrolase family esterase